MPGGQEDPLWQVLDDWKAPEVSAGFDQAVMARIRDTEASVERPVRGSWRDWLRSLSPAKVWGMSAAMATLVLAMVLLRVPATVAPPAPDVAGAEFSAQQVEMALDDLRMLEELYGTATTQEDSQNDRL
jgi:hypothetical protein